MPFSLYLCRARQIPILFWFFSLLGLAYYVSGLMYSKYFFIGPVAMSLCILYALKDINTEDVSIKIYWFFIIGGLLALATNILPNSHFVAIAGLHLLILGPILKSIIKVKTHLYSNLYDFFLGLMILLLLLLELIPHYFHILQISAAICGSFLYIIMTHLIHQNWGEIKKLYLNGSRV